LNSYKVRGNKSTGTMKTAAEQGAAPDRLQLRSLRSFLASVSALPAAGELGVSPHARGLYGATEKNGMNRLNLIKCEANQK
jgi:hypothetical protein